MSKTQGRATVFFDNYEENWICDCVAVPLDVEIRGVRNQLKSLCQKYLQILRNTTCERVSRSDETSRRRKLLSDLKCIPNGVRNQLESMTLAILLFKAYEELIVHGLRSCQRYLQEIISTDVAINAIDRQITNDKEIRLLLNTINLITGEYSEKHESLVHYLNKLSGSVQAENIYYHHPKLKYLKERLKNHFEQYPNSKGIIFCQSSFYMLEICNFLLLLQPLVKPMIYIDKRGKNATANFSQEAKNVVKKMFDCRQFNILVRACRDINSIDVDEVDLVIHIDIERHLLKETLWNNLDFDSQKVHIYSKKKAEKVFSTDRLASDAYRLNENLERKRKLGELNKSNSSFCRVSKKMKNTKMCDGFESFELDDRFLSKLDAEVDKQKIPFVDESVFLNDSVFGEDFTKEEKAVCGVGVTREKRLAELTGNDQRDLITNVQTEILVKTPCSKDPRNDVNQNDLAACLSPILGTLPLKNKGFSFSTPIRNEKSVTDFASKTRGSELGHQNVSSKPQAEGERPGTDGGGYDFIDFDLFEDWDDCGEDGVEQRKEVSENREVEPKKRDEKSLITLSQAMELVEKTEKANEEVREPEEVVLENESSENSIDLLTGEVVRLDKDTIENLFADSFNLSKVDGARDKSVRWPSDSLCKSVVFDVGCESVIVDFGESKEESMRSLRSRPVAAHRLNFDTEKPQSPSLKRLTGGSCRDIGFDSDNSLDEILQMSFFDKFKSDKVSASKQSKCSVVESNVNDNSTVKSGKEVEDNDSEELAEDSLKLQRKRGRFMRICESESEDDSMVKQIHQGKKLKDVRGEKRTSGKEFIDSEVEVSEGDEVSSDELVDDEKDEYDQSFVDDDSYFTQNASTEITAKYLESVKAHNGPRTFKIPKPKPYIPEDIYSQIPAEPNSEYEINSFCVDEIEYDEKELSALEIAEQVLEMERKNKKKRSNQRKRQR